jgi:hypothetical protein
MLGFQWVKTRVQSAEAQQVAGAVVFLSDGTGEFGENRARAELRAMNLADRLQIAAGQGMALAGARAWIDSLAC